MEESTVSDDGEALAERLELFRGYLLILAEGRMDPRLRGKLDPADVVQQALARAYERRKQFRGDTDAQRAAWLRTLLARAMVDAARTHGLVTGRGRAAERSLETALEASSMRLEGLLVADQSSPSQRADRNEQLLRLGLALARLPVDQRRAVEMRYLQNLAVAAIAEQMGKSVPAVAGLLQRGLLGLRQEMGGLSPNGPIA